MVSYYPWPPMAVALIAAATLSWRRLAAAGVLAGGLTAAAQGPSHAVWIWWVPLVAGLVVLLALSRPHARRVPSPGEPVARPQPEPGPAPEASPASRQTR